MAENGQKRAVTGEVTEQNKAVTDEEVARIVEEALLEKMVCIETRLAAAIEAIKGMTPRAIPLIITPPSAAAAAIAPEAENNPGILPNAATLGK